MACVLELPSAPSKERCHQHAACCRLRDRHLEWSTFWGGHREEVSPLVLQFGPPPGFVLWQHLKGPPLLSSTDGSPGEGPRLPGHRAAPWWLQCRHLFSLLRPSFQRRVLGLHQDQCLPDTQSSPPSLFDDINILFRYYMFKMSKFGKPTQITTVKMKECKPKHLFVFPTVSGVCLLHRRLSPGRCEVLNTEAATWMPGDTPVPERIAQASSAFTFISCLTYRLVECRIWRTQGPVQPDPALQMSWLRPQGQSPQTY